MARRSNHRTVVFVKDYATKKVGDEFTCDSMLASGLVQSKVAKYKADEGDSSETVSEPKQKSSPKTKEKK